MLIGPYTTAPYTADMFRQNFLETMSSPDILPQLNKFYHDIPIIPEDSNFMTIVYTLGESMWGSMDSFSVREVYEFISDAFEPVAQRPSSTESENPYLSMRVLEDRYAEENKMMQTVAQGQLHKAEMHFNNLSSCQIEQRVPDTLRNRKIMPLYLIPLCEKLPRQVPYTLCILTVFLPDMQKKSNWQHPPMH